MTEASLPFYILHQPIIKFVGFVIAGWELGVLPKFMLLSLVALMAIALVYEMLVRRIGLLRVFCGLRARQ